jgi:hypothetical protein
MYIQVCDGLIIPRANHDTIKYVRYAAPCVSVSGLFFLHLPSPQDMVQQFYDIVHQDVTDTQAKIRNTESEMERMQDAHRNDIRVRVPVARFRRV